MTNCSTCKHWHRPYAEWEKRLHYGACFRLEESIMTDDHGSADEFSTYKDFCCCHFEEKHEEKRN